MESSPSELDKLRADLAKVGPGLRSLGSEALNVLSHVPRNLGDLARALRGHAEGEEVLAGPATARPLVILVHGTGAAPWQWVVARGYLREAGLHSKCVTYASEQAIQASTVDVANQVRQLVRESDALHDMLHTGSGTVPIVLIGHSQGGLIARLVMNRISRVARVFLLHAPQRGATAAGAWNRALRLVGLGSLVKRSINDMDPGSEFTKWYQSQCVENDPRVYEAAGSADYIVPEEAFTVTDEARRYVGDYGHYSAVVSKILWTDFVIPNVLNLQ